MAVRYSADGQNHASTSAPPAPPFTVTCWVRIVTDRNTYSTFWDSAASTSSYTTLSTDVDGTTLRLFRADTGGLTGAAMTVGTWYRVGVSIDALGAAVLYQGTATGALTATSGNLGVLSAPTTLLIGESVFGGEWLNGRVAAFKHHSAVLTADEVAAELGQYQARRTADLVRYHPLLRAETVDYSGNARTLTGGTGATTEDGPPIPWSGGRPRLILPTAVSGAVHTETGSAAGSAAGSGSVSVTPATVHTDSGSAAARGAGSGARTLTPAAVHTKTGSGAARGAGTGSRTVTAAAVHTVTGSGAAGAAGSGVSNVIVVVVHDATGAATTGAAGSGVVELTTPQVHDKTGAGATRTAGIGTRVDVWAVPVYVDRPRARTLQLAPPVRFIAQHARTGEFLHWNLPVVDAVIELKLSGPTVISGKFTPEIRTLLDESGRPLLRGWGMWVHCEIDGVIRASGIVQPSSFTGQEWTLDCEGFSGYAHGIPYEGTYSVVGVDGIDVVQEIWRYLQSFPDAVQGVTVPRTATIPTKLGEPARTETAEDGTVTQVAAKPYELQPWDAKDCGTEVDTMAKAAPFDYVERYAWNADHSDVTKTLDIGYPRIGRRNEDVVFIQGQNVAVVIPLVESPDLYASAVVGVGAGQGAKAIRETVDMPDPDRLRRVFVYQDQKVTDSAEMRRLVTEERTRRGNAQEFTQITVHAKHRNAPFGSYGIGDDVLVQGEIPWVGQLRLWHRIVAIGYQPYTQYAVLSLKRSDRFRYGKAAA